MKGNRAMANALESACQPQEYSSRADTQVSQHAEQVPDLDKASTAGPMLATIAKGDDNDGISLSHSVLDLSANESLENHRDDKVTSLEHHGNGVSPGATHSIQPPAASSSPAPAAIEVHDSADSEDIVIDLEGSDDEDAPGSFLPPAGDEAPSAQPSSAAQQNSSLPEEQGSMQVRCCTYKAGLTLLLSSRVALSRQPVVL